MTSLQIAAVVFGAVFLSVIVLAIFFPPKSSPHAPALLRFLCAITGAFCGTLFLGDAVAKFEGASSAVKWTISGTAGFAIFFTVWLMWPKTGAMQGGAYNFTVPQGTKFESAVRQFCQIAGITVRFSGFTNDQLNSKLNQHTISTDKVSDALLAFGYLNNVVPRYKVSGDKARYELVVES